MPVQLLWHPNLSEVNWRNNHRIDELYDLNQTHHETRDVQFVAGRIIHSFIYIPYSDERGGLAGIFFTSDIDRNKKLYEMTIDDVITIFNRVGNDYPTNIQWRKNPDGTETMTISQPCCARATQRLPIDHPRVPKRFRPRGAIAGRQARTLDSL
jgi:hypothetical protein